MSAVKWPGNAYDPKAEDLSKPMQQLLQDLNLLEGTGTVTPLRTPPSLQVITAGSAALSKGWAAFVGVFGGAGALWTALKGFGADPQDQPLQRAVFVGSAAVLLAAVVIAIAIIVKGDVASRAEATAAEYAARAQEVRSPDPTSMPRARTASQPGSWSRRPPTGRRGSSQG